VLSEGKVHQVTCETTETGVLMERQDALEQARAFIGTDEWGLALSGTCRHRSHVVSGDSHPGYEMSTPLRAGEDVVAEHYDWCCHQRLKGGELDGE
jgi:hypothetical protein